MKEHVELTKVIANRSERRAEQGISKKTREFNNRKSRTGILLNGKMKRKTQVIGDKTIVHFS